jgi:hypothetical protein
MVVITCKKCDELNYLTPHAFWNITDFGAKCAITDPSGNVLHIGTTSPQPSILSPGQEAPFTHDVRTYEMGGHNGPFNYELRIQSQ